MRLIQTDILNQSSKRLQEINTKIVKGECH